MGFRVHPDCRAVGEGNFRTQGGQVLPTSESESGDIKLMDDLRSGILGGEEKGPGGGGGE